MSVAPNCTRHCLLFLLLCVAVLAGCRSEQVRFQFSLSPSGESSPAPLGARSDSVATRELRPPQAIMSAPVITTKLRRGELRPTAPKRRAIGAMMRQAGRPAWASSPAKPLNPVIARARPDIPKESNLQKYMAGSIICLALGTLALIGSLLVANSAKGAAMAGSSTAFSYAIFAGYLQVAGVFFVAMGLVYLVVYSVNRPKSPH
jgi:hypothetical protein